MLLLVHQHYQTGRQVGQLYQPRDLLAIKLSGDNQLEAFLSDWTKVHSRIKASLPEDFALQHLVSQLQNAPSLKEVIMYYERLPEGHEDRSYDYLMEQAERVVTQRLHERNRKDLVKSLNRTHSPTTRTQNCKQWMRGICTRGRDCPYIHDQSLKMSLAAPSMNSGRQDPSGGPLVSGKNKNKGDPKGSRPKLPRKERPPKKVADPPDQQQLPCFYNSLGKCSKGRDCPYIHRKLTPDELKRRDAFFAALEAKNKDKQAKECEKWKLGTCSKGAACKLKHVGESGAGRKKAATAVPHLSLSGAATSEIPTAAAPHCVTTRPCLHSSS